MNLYYSSNYFDNNWVMPMRMPDDKTYVGMTDTSNMLEIDLPSLTKKNFIKFNDTLRCNTGATHVQNLPNGDMVGVCGEISTSGQNSLTAYRINKESIYERISIGSVETEKAVY